MKLPANVLAIAIGISATSFGFYSIKTEMASLRSEIAALKGTKASTKEPDARQLCADRKWGPNVYVVCE
jgi:hypothetical protein